MDDKSLEMLEFPRILERLARHTSFSAGRELALALRPSPDPEEVRRRLAETGQARALLSSRSCPSLGGVKDVRPLAKDAQRGIVLSPAQLLDIRDTLQAGKSLRRALLHSARQFPLLAAIAGEIEECPHLIEEIGRCLSERGEVMDKASAALAHIRGQLRDLRGRLLNRLQRIIADPANAPYIQEPLITQRGGRYVIPLKAEFKGRIRGLVHDTSASGATLFIEPMEVVELGNRLRELEVEEEREVRRILAALSQLVARDATLIERTVEALARLDLAFAKARYADEIEGVEPKLIPPSRRVRPLRLYRARNPLLDPATVVPIDVPFREDFSALVITGPNTGGKTVTLKTVGLLSAMAQSGLFIPAQEGSTLPIFSGIYADIGEEQSIEQSLSTFSSHMGNIIRILELADEHSLVLLDELGAGTDPVEGSALARAILSHLLKRGITTLVATHYPELKAFAHVTPGVENACVEFDAQTLMPTYELTIGLPGRSNAFAIASRLGLAPAIVEEARKLVSPQAREAEELLAGIREAHRKALAARQEAERMRQEAERERRKLEERLHELRLARREILEAARAEIRREIRALREELKALRARLKAAPPTEEAMEEVATRLEELEKKARPPEPVKEPTPTPTIPPQVGDLVRIKSLGVVGTLVELTEGEAEVRAGNFRIRARQEELERVEGGEEKEEGAVTISVSRPSVSLELDLRGLKAEEALRVLDKRLDEAFLAGLPFLHIIHGKGTGTLRRLVREHLKGHPLVDSYRPGGEGEGGEGVTVAQLVNR